MHRHVTALAALARDPITRGDASLWLFLSASLLSILGVFFTPDVIGMPLLAAAGALVALGVVLRVAGAPSGPLGRRKLAGLISGESGACIVTDAGGRVHLSTVEARHRLPVSRGHALSEALGAVFADPARAISELLDRASEGGAATRLCRSPQGTLRVSVTRASARAYLWRFDGGGDWVSPAGLPMLRATTGGVVLSVNPAARALVGGVPQTTAELGLDGLPPDEVVATGLDTADGRVWRGGLRLAVGPDTDEIYLLPSAPPPIACGLGPAESEAGEQALLETLPVALLELERDGHVRFANGRARQLLELAPGIPANLCDLLEGLGRPIRDWLDAVAEGRAPSRGEVVRAALPDRDTYLRITLDRHGRGGGLVAVLDDVTAMKSLEAQFAQSQKTQAIGQLAGGIAHDFNNLLTAISGHCDLLMLRHDAGDPDYGDLVQIHQNANRAASLVGQLLAFSRKQTLRPEVLDLRDTLGELGHLLDRLVGERVRLRMRHAPDLPPVRADKRQLEQVVMNLVVNARDAMPDGGIIRLETEFLHLSAPERRDRAEVPPGAYAVIHVSDDGLGIAPDKLSKIFEPFYTTKRTGEGTGLGLSTAYGIIKQTGGFIFVESVPGQGSCFSVYLPAHMGPVVAQAPVDPGAEEDPQEGGVVLLVEDEAPVRAFAVRALRLKGHTVLEAANGEDALDLLEDDALAPDILVTDMVMPEMDGPTLAAEVRIRRPGLPVLFMSGHAEDSMREARLRLDKAEFLQKPFSLEMLAAAVRRGIRAGRDGS
ncbi:two-component system cell cycle sensor histidine kinase/response regulator CckA [Rhodovulum bhavnagarense]|uniref:histidine kinase n=1 Tax=Rhodovulum bhavnagarense TaxID=992286 RepID=A0A4R2RI39_9RHOB|nr:ATP-binding protein [Rhodovulum bhavnagarense]TCP63432.1 two-component system cell cycle sensor histidine kinase/response regulator CckA [Rhodovulum bhavnagarense]